VEYATILVDIGNCYYFKDFYDEALKSYFEALFIIEKMEGEHLFEKGNVFNNIGNAYFCKI
jgi:tetratricopeptide (TPR) repeat protein